MRETFHLVPDSIWAEADPDGPYEAVSLGDEGFAHCTDGIDELGATFDRYYAADERRFVALTIDLDALDVPWRYDVPGSPYPHIYGRFARSAVLHVRRVERQSDGRFAGLSPVVPSALMERSGPSRRGRFGEPSRRSGPGPQSPFRPTTEKDSGIRPRSSSRTSA